MRNFVSSITFRSQSLFDDDDDDNFGCQHQIYIHTNKQIREAAERNTTIDISIDDKKASFKIE